MSPLVSPTTTLGNISSWVAYDLGLDGVTLSHSITCSTRDGCNCMEKTLDTLAAMGESKIERQLLMGFALETRYKKYKLHLWSMDRMPWVFGQHESEKSLKMHV